MKQRLIAAYQEPSKVKKNATENHDTKSAVYFIFLMNMKDYVN